MTAASLPADLAGDEATPDPVTHALNLAAAGLAVLPVLADKRPAPGYGVTSATTDPQAIADAFITTGAPLVGVACGASGIVVVDIDRHPGAPDGLASVAEAGVELPATWTHISMSGTGLHAVYAAPGEPVSAAKPLPGVDLKAGNGYVVWPLSAGVPRREQFAPLPAWASLPRGDAGGEIPDETVAEWIGGNAGPIAPEGDLARALAALPPHGSPEWNDANLIPLARSIATAAQWETGGALAREQFIARYAAGEWATPEHRKAAARAFDKAADRFGMPYPLVTSAPVIEIATRTDLEAPAGVTSARKRMADLAAREFRPLDWVVPGLIPEGTTLIAAPPKAGKSWLALDIGAACALGAHALGSVHTGQPRPVMLLDFESGERRLSARMAAQEWDVSKADAFYYHLDRTTALDELEAFMREHRGQRPLAIVDTLVGVQTDKPKDRTWYKHDYESIARLQRMTAADPGSAITVVHHTKKDATGDPMEAISGTNGIAGAVDTPIVFHRRDRHAPDASLNIMARDFEGGEYALVWSTTGHRWTLTGGTLAESADAYLERERQERLSKLGPGKRSLIDIIESHRGEPVSIEQARAQYLGENPDRVRKYLSELADAGLIARAGYGAYQSA